jgi:sporulation protein YlmC with PRC-barrel domain
MIRALLTTTALTAVLVTGAIAQEATTAGPSADSQLLTQGYQIVDTDGLASRLIGFPVYSSAADDAERIGEINDLVVGQDGNVAAVIVGVGGFLGVGEKNVAVEYPQLQWTTAADNTERLVLETTKEALNAAPAIEWQEDTPQTAAAPAAPAAGTDDDAAMETGSVSQQPAAEPGAAAVPIDRSALTDVDEMTLTAEELIGTSVYGPNDEHMGVIGDFVLGEDGKTIDAVVIDVGGFLGIGAKEVAVGFENLNFAADANNNRFLLLNVTKDQLDAQTAFNRDTYMNERDNQRMVVQSS